MESEDSSVQALGVQSALEWVEMSEVLTVRVMVVRWGSAVKLRLVITGAGMAVLSARTRSM